MFSKDYSKGYYYFQLPVQYAFGVSCLVKKSSYNKYLVYLVEYLLTLFDYIFGKKLSKTWIFDEVIYSKSYIKTYHFLNKNRNLLTGKRILVVFKEPPEDNRKDFQSFGLDLYFVSQSSRIRMSNYQDEGFKYYYLENLNNSNAKPLGCKYLNFDNSKTTSKCIIAKNFNFH